MKAMSDGDICDMIEEVTARIQKLENDQARALEDRSDIYEKIADIYGNLAETITKLQKLEDTQEAIAKSFEFSVSNLYDNVTEIKKEIRGLYNTINA